MTLVNKQKSVPEEDVLGLPAGVGVYKLFLEMFQGAVVDINWTLELAVVTCALLGKLPAEAVVEICFLRFRKLDSIFVH